MAVFKCKMCGGALEVNNETVATCSYCGTQQTLPKLDDEKRAQLYDRANYFRRENEFDKAMGIYEMILGEEKTDSEAYWGIVLCRYGIEYVEDPRSHRRIPTVNRAQFTSIFEDEDYKSALQYADSLQKNIYENEAKVINDIQKGILAISQKEEPFDVFICYKETDNNGRRTPDSVLATELYHELVREGYKVFFSRITLEDKLGSAYEPYIFAALNSAKVMVVLGTKPEHFNAVWVKNEWNRYLALIKNGAKKMLIPAFKDMDPYDLPDEFSHLQAQDMSKLGFMQDLIRGIKKLVQTDTPLVTVTKETVVINSGNTQIEPLLKRAFMFLEDGDFVRADDFCEQVLNIEPECAQAYLGKMMVECKARTLESLKLCRVPFDVCQNYSKVMRFGDNRLKGELQAYLSIIKKRNEDERVESIYSEAINVMKSATKEKEYKSAAKLFHSVIKYKDSEALLKKCLENAESIRKHNEEKNKKKNTIAVTVSSIVSVIGIFVIVLVTVIIPNSKYNDAIALMEAGKYTEAIAAFEEMDGYKDSIQKIEECHTAILDGRYNAAVALMDAGKYDDAISAFEALDGYKKSAGKIEECDLAILDNEYNIAIDLMNSGEYKEAIFAFEALESYKDSTEKAADIYEKYKAEKLKSAEVGDYILFGSYEQDANSSNGTEYVEWLVLDVKDGKALVISKYALDHEAPYSYYTTWDISSIRQWLNGDFVNSVFNSDELDKIPTVTVITKDNEYNGTDGGNNTTDKVFLLSVDEVYKYFEKKDRVCKATLYAEYNGVSIYSNSFCYWLLRSPGAYSGYASFIDTSGEVVGYDTYDVLTSLMLGKGSVAIRPAMWIEIE